MLQSRGDLEAVLSQTEAALESYGLAVKAYERALELAPDDIHALNNQGIVLQRRGDLEAVLSQT